MEKSGKPCHKLTALCCAAKALIVAKMVVPTAGSLAAIVKEKL
jgi:hypothetical protein